jgi:hypothetical protein
MPNDESDHSLFKVATMVTIGDRKRAHFLPSCWLVGFTPKLVAPKIFKACKHTKHHSVHVSMEGQEWISDINVNNFDMENMEQFIQLWGLLSDFQLSSRTKDSIVWIVEADGKYSS